MIIIIGLGNPGEKYSKTRHNIGFRIIDEFRKKNNFLEFKLSKKFNSLISEESIDGKKIILAKPQTFMNESGKTAKAIFNFQFSIFNQFLINKFSNKNLIVIHDDIDLPLGKIRISKNRGSAGHKGVESIIKEIGNKNFIRIRIGIYPKQYHRLVYSAEKIVLQKFSKEEEKIIKTVIKKSIEAIEFLITKGLEKTMNIVNH